MSWQTIAIIAIVTFGVLPLIFGGLIMFFGFREAKNIGKRDKW